MCKSLLGKIFLKLFFILRKDFLKRNLTITLISTTKSNFILSYPNKNHSLKITFDTFKTNKNNSCKSNFLKDFLSKVILLKVK